MDSTKILNELDRYRDSKTKEFEWPTVYKMSHERIIEIFNSLYNSNLSLKDNKSLLLELFKIVDLKSSIYLKNRNFLKSLELLDIYEVIVINLLELKAIDFFDYLSYYIKYTYSLASNMYILEAITQTKGILSFFKLKEKEIKKGIKGRDSWQKDYTTLLIYIKSVLKYMKKKCAQENFLKERSEFYIQEREFEYRHLREFNIESILSEEIVIIPDVPRIGKKVTTIWYGSNKKEYKGKRIIKFYLNFICRILLNRLSKYIWLYGESRLRVVIYGISTIIFYAILMQIKVIKIIDVNGVQVTKFFNYLYFSIVTFTSLGYGDMRPATSSLFSKNLMAFEAILGLFCISIVIYLIGKKSMK